MTDYKIPTEFIDYIAEVMEFGASKHGDNNWQQPSGKKSSHRQMHHSILGHVAESYAGKTTDTETGLHPLQHAATRCLMQLYRVKHNLIHSDDKGNL